MVYGHHSELGPFFECPDCGGDLAVGGHMPTCVKLAPARTRWDEWRGSTDGRPSMLIKRLFDRWGYRVDLHKFIRADDDDCKHTHPATAIRIVLWGGYEEELRDGSLRVLRPGTIGVVRPELCHRINRLLNGRSSYSLWLRGRKCAPVEIVGSC